MKKVLLIEDRSERQTLLLKTIKLSEYSDILDNMIKEKYEKIFESLKNDSFDFYNYSVIITHQSAFKDDNISILKKLEKHCKENKKTLVLFSGGIDSKSYLEEEGYQRLDISSKTLYSEHIELFLEDAQKGNNNPLILSFGKKWEISILLNILEQLNIFIGEIQKDKILYSVFLRDNPKIELINSLDIELYKPTLEGKKIYKEEIKKLRDSILEYIQNKATQ
jgi:hypothetical protein